MKNWSIGKRLTVGFGVVMVIMAMLLVVAIANMRQMQGAFDQVMTLNAAKIEKANTAIKAIDQIFYNMAVMLMAQDAAVIEEHGKVLAEKRQEQLKAFESLAKLEQTQKGKELIAECKEASAKGKEANAKAMKLKEEGNQEEAMTAYVAEARPFAIQIIGVMEKLVRVQQDEMSAAHQAAAKASGLYQTVLVLFGAVALGFAIAITMLLTRSITVPLQRGVSIADHLANGELNVDVVVDRQDEVGQLLGSMENMVQKWKSIVGQIGTIATHLSSASMEMSASAEQMSSGALLQAERASLVASSSEEMSQTVLDIARNTDTISRSAEGTAQTAREGQNVVGRAVNEVKEIASTVNDSAHFVESLGSRSNQIGEIVGVINEIAEQTNLLALNAAIEAARAGEQGRGFAVVADEVRKLAERTGLATSEIRTMIKAIQDEVGKAVEVMIRATSKVDQGVKLSEDAGNSLSSIVRSVDDLQIMVQQIASATEEMGATSGQISKDIEEIANVSRDTSSSSEETASASAELAKLSANLKTIVDEFRL